MEKIQSDKDKTLESARKLKLSAQASESAVSFCQKIKEMSKLEIGWNGYKAEPPNKVAIELALLAVEILDGLAFLPNFVSPSSENGIGFTFENSGRFGYAEFFNNGEICMLTDIEGNNREVWQVISKQHLSENLKKVRAFIQD